MEFAFIVSGLLVGKLWTRLVTRQIETASITHRAPARQLCSYIVVAALTGVAIGVIELHVLSSGPTASALSKGLIAGFAWSPWFVGSARLLYAHHQPKRAAAYLTAAPALALACVLGGYLSLHLDHRLT
jgi:fluoride ion exporter CrcB/FEX